MNASTVVVIAAVVAIPIVLVASLPSTPDPIIEARENSRAAISHCWEQYEQKSLEPGTKRFVAAACESLERKFSDRYGMKP